MVRLLLCLLGSISRCAGWVQPRRQKRNWGGLSLQSLLLESHGFTRSTRGGKAMPVETFGVL